MTDVRLRSNSPQTGSATSKVTLLFIKNAILSVLISHRLAATAGQQWLVFPRKEHRSQHTSHQKVLALARSLLTIYWNESQRCSSLFSESSNREPDNTEFLAALETRKCPSATACLPWQAVSIIQRTISFKPEESPGHSHPTTWSRQMPACHDHFSSAASRVWEAMSDISLTEQPGDITSYREFPFRGKREAGTGEANRGGASVAKARMRPSPLDWKSRGAWQRFSSSSTSSRTDGVSHCQVLMRFIPSTNWACQGPMSCWQGGEYHKLTARRVARKAQVGFRRRQPVPGSKCLTWRQPMSIF